MRYLLNLQMSYSKKQVSHTPKNSYRVCSNGNIIPSSVKRENQKYSEAPPTRLSSITLDLCYWLGFHDASGNHELHSGAIDGWERIKKAYESGKASHPNSKTNQPNAKKSTTS